MRRIRRTIYADPGNPFGSDSEEVEEDVSIFTMPFRPASGESLHSIDRCATDSPFDSTDSGHANVISSRSSIDLLNGSPFEDAIESPGGKPESPGIVKTPCPLQAPIPQRRAIPSLVQEPRRSLAATLVNTEQPTSSDRSGVDPFPQRTFWPKTKPFSPFRRGKVELSGEDRNTVFYGFYDSLLEEYKGSEGVG